ncbi:MAG: helix-hairpin-helix domain-containing protein [Bacteroidetes bacterium SB0662_bin_6]|nr:helix-hairpin-helix domain-containing protein [Bacteroidetes bacterium SB0668_bin_1]MYE04550.1 helix-hairpin-helix domain-containing protein [Bacteroidetes bacterium SB0662_bin_6]
MRLLHRLQQRLSLTRHEAMALSCLSGLLIIGIIVRQVQQQAILLPPDAYDELDRIFFERSGMQIGGAADTTSPALAASASEADSGKYEAAATASSTREPPGEPSGSGALHIDINRAGASELEKLPRIGPKTAERILAFRDAYGAFRSADDLQQVKGIGPKTLELLRPHVYAGAHPPSVDSSSGDSSAEP